MAKAQQIEDFSRGLDIPILESLVTEGCNNIPIGVKQAVLVIGDTGSGKSTLINALTGKDLTAVAIEVDLDTSLILRGSVEGPKIGDTSVSETTVPQIWKDKTNVSYFDCPGFEDTKGAEQDIANGVFVNKLFKSIDEVKIVLVVSQNQLLSDRSKDVIKLIKKLTAMFPNQDQIKNCMSLVLSKAKNTVSPEKIKNYMAKTIADHENDNSSTTFYNKIEGRINTAINIIGMGPQKELNKVGEMWKLVMNSNICVFNSPDKEGPYILDKAVVASINQKTTYAIKPDVNIAISDQSKVLIRSTYDYLVKSTASKIKALGKEIDEFKFRDAQEEQLISKLIKIKDILSAINSDKVRHNVDKHNIAEFSEKIAELYEILGIKQDGISPLVEMFSLLKRVVSDGITQEVSECLKGFDELDSKIIKEVTHHTTLIKNTITKNIEGLIQSSYDSILGISEAAKQKLKVQMQALSKFQNFEYIEKAANLIYQTVKTEDTKTYCDAIINSIKLIKDINKTLQHHDQIILSTSEIQAGITSIMSGMLLSEQELAERKLKIEKTKELVESSYYISKANQSNEPNSIKITGNKLSINEEHGNRIIGFHKELTSKNVYLNYGKYTIILGVSSIHFDSSIKMSSGNLFICAPLIKFNPEVEFNLSGQDGVGYTGSKAASGTWNASAAMGNVTAMLSLIPIANIVAQVKYMEYYREIDPVHRKAGSQGDPGKDGEPGFPGGNLIMLAYNYQGLEGLKVNINGGNGGDGQNGGDGGSCNESYMTAPDARAGGDGGNGGNAGQGGPCGFIKIFKVDKEKKLEDKSNNLNLTALEGKPGNPGVGGDGGKGWKGMIASSGVDGIRGENGTISLEMSKFTCIDFINEENVKTLYKEFVNESPNQGPEIETLGELGYIPFV